MKDLSEYISIIKNGGVVAFPTETVYGLGADARNPSAIQKVFEIKGRPSDNPLIVHVSTTDQVSEFAAEIPVNAQKLMDEFWPGPLSIVLPKLPEVLDSITAGLDTVAIRMPDHPDALELIKATGPLVAPSANRSGKPSPTKADHVRTDFGDDVPVIDGAATRVGLESTVIDLSSQKPAILRPGSISRKELESVLGTEVEESFFHQVEKPRSPGQKYSHYKPKASVRWITDKDNRTDPSTLYLLISDGSNTPNSIFYNNDLSHLAAELYDRFRQADLDGFKTVLIEPFSDDSGSISTALKNRIIKAIG